MCLQSPPVWWLSILSKCSSNSSSSNAILLPVHSSPGSIGSVSSQMVGLTEQGVVGCVIQQTVLICFLETVPRTVWIRTRDGVQTQRWWDGPSVGLWLWDEACLSFTGCHRRNLTGDSLLDGRQRPISLKVAGIQKSWSSMTPLKK